MEAFGERLQALGMQLLPFSLGMYLPVRLLEYVWEKGYTRLVKGIWYGALGLAYLTGGVDTDVIVMFICFIEACDLFFQQLEIGRERKAAKSAAPKARLR